MKTLAVALTLCVAALLVACGGGASSTVDGRPCTPNPGEPSPAPQASTLEGARALVSFDVRVPSRLPNGFEFAGATHLSNPCPDGVLRLYYADNERRVGFELKQSPHGIQAGGTAHEPAIVGGVEAEVVQTGLTGSAPEGRVHVNWSKDSMSFIASSTLTDDWTFVDLLEVLDSIS